MSKDFRGAKIQRTREWRAESVTEEVLFLVDSKLRTAHYGVSPV